MDPIQLNQIPNTGIPFEKTTIIRAITGEDITIILIVWGTLWYWAYKKELFGQLKLNERQQKALMYFNMIAYPILIGIYVLWAITKVKTLG